MTSTKEISTSSEDTLKGNLLVEEQWQSKLLSFERMGSPVVACVSLGLPRQHLPDSLQVLTHSCGWYHG